MSERKIDGRKAEIINTGKEYTTYTSFAGKYGYPEAAAERDEADKRKPLKDGDVVTLLVSGSHHWPSYSDPIWIVEAANGERHLIGEDGLRIIDAAPITVLPDESLGGILREYCEVKRKAAVGEQIKITAGPDAMLGEDFAGDVFLVTGISGFNTETDGKWNDGSVLNPAEDDYVVLEPANIVHIDSARFRMVDRKATPGERVIIVNEGRESSGGHYYRIGNVGETLGDGFTAGNIRVKFSDGSWAVSPGDYSVLEPVKCKAETGEASATQPLSTRPATLLSSRSSAEQAAENIAALTAKVQTLETRLNDLYEWHKHAAVDLRVAREDLVLIEEGVSGDIATVKSRVAALEDRVMFELTGLTRKKADEIGSVAKQIIAAKAEEPQKSAQQIRDEIVEQAKNDVIELGRHHWNGSGDFVYGRGSFLYRAEFVVNRDKRTVACLLRKYLGGAVLYRGISKCAPNDVFNAHIGRVLALRRALGLEIPAEYLSVPGPEEVRVGDVVRATGPSAYLPKTAGVCVGRAEGGLLYAHRHEGRKDGNTWAFEHDVSIIDDSREGENPSSARKGAAA